ncbi:sorting nexin-12 isoform X1 [Chlorocebus sabaeus]|uniref:sorting nexin-12 isoform X1 n=1 Tax=Chlorocebus sabaeus TaxID=60711 RepID=UPI003BFA33D7
MSDTAVADTRRLNSKPQDLTDAYGPPSNFLEIDIFNPQTVGVGRARFTTYEVRMRTNLPIFKLKESCVRRRYSDFEWLKNELERDSKIVVPPLPGKALKRQLPFRGDEGIFEESFIEERRQGLEQFINKIAGHPLAQNERCLHMFLQEEAIDRNYVPGKQPSEKEITKNILLVQSSVICDLGYCALGPPEFQFMKQSVSFWFSQVSWPPPLPPSCQPLGSRQGRVMLQNGRQANLGAGWIRLHSTLLPVI